MSIYFHEQLHRTPELMKKLRDFPVTICGAGALGANIAENLARSGCAKLRIIDRDRIEERNLSTQPYYRSDVGAYKTKILVNIIYRALGITVEGITKELTAANTTQLLSGSKLVIDAFDNSIARQAVTDNCSNLQIPCLHVGLAADYAEMIWNPVYRVPSAANDDVCDYPLARNLVILAVAIASETAINFISTQQQQSFTVTLADFAVKPFNI
ncbi:ThiF family adenylyltransferase [Calothrix sp. UHCC 0171]|uniref:ThiF family adenylyltransferase n=1 Tax=Calothrix sp. UHCC 0171 TaxID=3110245 RepID=UPI002B1F6890|nr:ThiF family adenylyltransferase [Calothrix sp. UHCC 0171]MEA5572812.1 ThiF family adenylyltransferase [Calothrix sp. UHCC 0171]